MLDAVIGDLGDVRRALLRSTAANASRKCVEVPDRGDRPTPGPNAPTSGSSDERSGTVATKSAERTEHDPLVSKRELAEHLQVSTRWIELRHRDGLAGRFAAIGSIRDTKGLLRGEAGTRVALDVARAG